MLRASAGRAVRLTGVMALQSQLAAKRVELLKELLPAADKLSVFTNEQTSEQLSLAQGTARRLGLPLHVMEFKRPPFDYEARLPTPCVPRLKRSWCSGPRSGHRRNTKFPSLP